MAHKTLISGTAYSVTGGRELIGGTGYGCKAGKTIIGGTAFIIPFAKGPTLSSITPGGILMLNESGNPIPFYIAKHDYEPELNGAGRTLIVRKDCGAEKRINIRNNYENGDADYWNRWIWTKLLDADVIAALGSTKFYYTPGNGNNTVTVLNRTAFQLSAAELGLTASTVNAEGTELPIASMLKIAYTDGSAVFQWTRTPRTDGTTKSVMITDDGYFAGIESNTRDFCRCRPAFTIPGNLSVVQNPDGTYTLAA
jgi:hypothetical protein